jgi:hypothetical protein
VQLGEAIESKGHCQLTTCESPVSLLGKLGIGVLIMLLEVHFDDTGYP